MKHETNVEFCCHVNGFLIFKVTTEILQKLENVFKNTFKCSVFKFKNNYLYILDKTRMSVLQNTYFQIRHLDLAQKMHSSVKQFSQKFYRI